MGGACSGEVQEQRGGRGGRSGAAPAPAADAPTPREKTKEESPASAAPVAAPAAAAAAGAATVTAVVAAPGSTVVAVKRASGPIGVGKGKDAAESLGAVVMGAASPGNAMGLVQASGELSGYMSAFSAGSGAIITAAGQVSGIALAVIGVLAGLYHLLEASTSKQRWIAEFREELRILAMDLAGSRDAFGDNPWIDRVAAAINGMKATVERVAARGKVATFMLSSSDRSDLAECKVTIGKLRQDALTSMMNSIKGGQTQGFADVQKSMADMQAMLADQLKRTEVDKQELERDAFRKKLAPKEDSVTSVQSYLTKYIPDSRTQQIGVIKSWADRVANSGKSEFTDDNICWIQGEEHAGKSYFLSATIASLQSQVGALFVGPSSDRTSKSSFRNLIRGLSSQLALNLPDFFVALNRPERAHSLESSFDGSDAEMFQNLIITPLSECQSLPPQYHRQLLLIAIDGFERFDDLHPIRAGFGFSLFMDRAIMRTLPPWIGFVITSRQMRIVEAPYNRMTIQLEDDLDETNQRMCSLYVEREIGPMLRGNEGMDHSIVVQQATNLLTQLSCSHLWYAAHLLKGQLANKPFVTLADIQTLKPYSLWEERIRQMEHRQVEINKVAECLHMAVETPFANVRHEHSKLVPNSRMELVQQVQRWSVEQQISQQEEFTDENVFWIKGAAGAGKRMLSCALVSDLSSLPCLHYRKSGDDHPDGVSLWQSIAVQIAYMCPLYYSKLEAAKEKITQILAQSPNGSQREKSLFALLFQESLSACAHSPPPVGFSNRRLVIIIDGFHQFDHGRTNETAALLCSRSSMKHLPKWIGFVITSRHMETLKEQYIPRVDLSDIKDEQNKECCRKVIKKKIEELIKRNTMAMAAGTTTETNIAVSSPTVDSSPFTPNSDATSSMTPTSPDVASSSTSAASSSSLSDVSLSACADSLAERSHFYLWYALKELQELEMEVNGKGSNNKNGKSSSDHSVDPITLAMIDAIPAYSIADGGKKKIHGIAGDVKSGIGAVMGKFSFR